MIPSVAHFIWYGRAFPWVNVLAVKSALERGGFDRVVLHHDEDLSATPYWKELAGQERFESRAIDARAALQRYSGLAAIYARLEAPNARANVLRAAVLAAEGGLYLDMDTVTVRPLAPLCAGAGVLCGTERVVFPARVLRSGPGAKARALALVALRDTLRRLPGGWRAFRRVERFYPLAVNNAVFGCAPGHPFARALLETMATVPPERERVPFALGTHLLQDQVASYPGHDLVVQPPEVFYPLGPEISEHWFRRTRRPALDELVTEETRLVHWYASVRTKRIAPRIDPDYVRANAGRQLFSALVEPLVREWYR